MKFRLMFVILLFTLLLGCQVPPKGENAIVPEVVPSGQLPTSDQTAPDAPLPTGQEVPPPPGCVELRERGGAC